MSYISNPDFFRGLDVYKKIILELNQLENPIIYLFNKYKSETPLIELFISDVVNRGNFDIKKLWEEAFIDEGNTIVSTKSKINLFYKKILQLETPNNTTIADIESKVSNTDDFSVTTSSNAITINIGIEETSAYSVKVVNLRNYCVQTIVPEIKVQAGEYEHTINVPNGNYVVVYYLNGNINAKKVIVK